MRMPTDSDANYEKCEMTLERPTENHKRFSDSFCFAAHMFGGLGVRVHMQIERINSEISNNLSFHLTVIISRFH